MIYVLAILQLPVFLSTPLTKQAREKEPVHLLPAMPVAASLY